MAVAVADDDETPTAHARSIRDEALWLAKMQDRVDQLVREYRVRGHLMAQLDPLGIQREHHPPELDPALLVAVLTLLEVFSIFTVSS